MQKIFPAILLSLIFICYRQVHENKAAKKDNLLFRTQISPSFEEGTDIILSKFDTIQAIRFILIEANGNDKPVRIFYEKAMDLSKEQFDKLDSDLLKKIRYPIL